MLCDNLSPVTGTQLTARQIDHRRVGWDFNFNATKSVSLALELTGDERILEARCEAVKEAMRHVEADMKTRVRAGGEDEDRATGSLVAMRVTHRTPRPNRDDHLPDPWLHDHVVVFNATWDDSEDKWAAARIGD